MGGKGRGFDRSLPRGIRHIIVCQSPGVVFKRRRKHSMFRSGQFHHLHVSYQLPRYISLDNLVNKSSVNMTTEAGTAVAFAVYFLLQEEELDESRTTLN